MPLGSDCSLSSGSQAASCRMPPPCESNCVPSLIAASIATWLCSVRGSMRLPLDFPMDAISAFLSTPLPRVAFFLRKNMGYRDSLVKHLHVWLYTQHIPLLIPMSHHRRICAAISYSGWDAMQAYV